MKKLLSSLLALVMLATTIFAVPLSAQAEVKYPEASGTLLSDQTFTYDSITETLTISGEGAITGYNWTGTNVSPFEYCTVKHIVIEEGITALCNYLFHRVYGIESFSIPASVTTIEVYAMSYATFAGGAGNGFTVADGNESFCADNGTLYNKSKTKLIKFVNSDAKEFTVPGTVSSIEHEAFYSDVTLDKLVLNGSNLSLQNYAIRGAKIKHLEINEGVKSLGDYSSIDSDVWADETITLPASLTNIGTQSLFGNKIPIKNFDVAEDNPVFSVIDGVLYKNGTTLFSYPGGRTDTSYTVPDNTTTILGFAFTYRNNLESIDFPASVKNFSGRCLCYCSNLTTVNIRALDAGFLAADCFYGMNSSVVYNVYENSVTQKNLLDYGIAESKIAFLPLCAEHSYQLTKAVEPTCYAKGYDLYTCTICNTTENRNETNMVDHEVVTTYNEDKTIEHHKCKNYGFVIEETENLPESEHDYQSNIDAYYELSYPGVDTISITFDNQFNTELRWDYLEAYDKNGNEIAKYEGTTPAGQTYTLNGDYIKLYFHSDSSNNHYGFKITKVVAEKIGCDYTEPDTPHTHSYGDYVSDGNATCTENGTETATCACGETTNRTEENSALGHDYDLRAGETPTCTTGGHNLYLCLNCGEEYREELDPLGHDLVKTADAVNPTCFSVGWTAGYECSRCDYEVRQEEVAKIAHTTKATITRATTSADGKIVKTCTVCKKTLSTTVIPKASNIKLSTTLYTYDGKVKTPSVTVKDSKGKTLKRNTDYTVSYASGRKYVGKYAVKVTFKGNYSGSKILYFTVKPRATSISSLAAGSKSFSVKWRKQTSQITGYQVQYSTSSKFTKAKTYTFSSKTTSKKVTRLSGKKKYYVRVRTYKRVGNTNYFSSWSGAKAVVTKR